MTPESLGETYRGYKINTAKVVTWVAQTATYYGYQASSTGTNGLEKDIVTTRELQRQAEFIAQRGRGLFVPVDVQQAFYGAIEARIFCKKWYSKNAGKEKEVLEANSSHAYFIKVLDDIFRQLLPFFEDPAKKKGKGTSKSTAGTTSAENARLKAMQNRFQHIQIDEHDIKMKEDSETNLLGEARRAEPRPAKIDSQKKYEMEESSDEQAFKVYCFLEDAKKLRKHLESVWQEVAEGKLHSGVAAIVTNVALGLLREEDLSIKTYLLDAGCKSKEVQRDGQNENSYLFILNQMFPAQSEQSNERTLIEAEDTTYFSTFRSMEYFVAVRHNHEAPKSERDPSLETVPTKRHLRSGEYWKQGSELLKNEDWLLMQVLFDAHNHFVDKCNKEELRAAVRAGWFEDNWSCRPFVEDAIIDSLSGLAGGARTEEICFYHVFFARIALDIHRILGEKRSDPYRDLLLKAAVVNRDLHISMTPSGHRSDFPECCGESWKATEALIRITHYEIVRNSRASVARHGIEGLIKSLKDVPDPMSDAYFWIIPSFELDFGYQQIPLSPALQNLKLMLKDAEHGIHVSNCSFVVPVVAHLYNALRQLGYLNTTWAAMDQVIEAHISPLFRGHLPDTRTLIRKRLLLLLGVPASELNRKGDDFRFDYRRQTPLSLPEIAKEGLEYLLDENTSRNDTNFIHQSHRVWKKSHVNKKGSFSTLDMLRHLKENFSKLVMYATPDYAALYTTCIDFLVAIGVNKYSWKQKDDPKFEKLRERLFPIIFGLLISTDPQKESQVIEDLKDLGVIFQVLLNLPPTDCPKQEIPPLIMWPEEERNMTKTPRHEKEWKRFEKLSLRNDRRLHSK
ncbi:hypothetical protein HYFRA_00012854 [Hymenoscyphus fraxineus]|uniref:DUF6604 domain-containing protein n=1 Tax=Hymenoscyphus fraxineus TaxID=746836 RepID=A0A9N9L6N0_9HELO|nr:hypothetical protein HYFRA_00012854 [Hymenoscyphus fraxineus]